MNFGALKRGLSASYMKNDKAEEELKKSGFQSTNLTVGSIYANTITGINAQITNLTATNIQSTCN